MSSIIFDFVDLIVGTLNSALLLLGVDMQLYDISIGFYTDWFVMDLYTLFKVVVAVFVWFMIIRITWNILKGVFKRVKGRF